MEIKQIYPRLSQFFGGYFNQDYDVMLDDFVFDRSKPLVPQMVREIKKENSEKSINLVIEELEQLISKHYTNAILDQISSQLGNDIDVERFGYTYQQFLHEVLKYLKE